MKSDDGASDGSLEGITVVGLTMVGLTTNFVDG
jgi:hypothetical protein